jgi:hypothetical protein
MNIDIRIDITPGSARRAAYVGLTLLVLGLAGIASAVPVKFTAGQRLTAEQLNQNFSDLDEKVAALTMVLQSKADKTPSPVVTEWQEYTPELRTDKDALVGGQIVTGYYRRVGDSLEATVVASFTAAPNSGAKCWQVTVPAGLAIDVEKLGGIGTVFVGGGFAQRPEQNNVVLGTYVRTPTGVSAVADGAMRHFLDDDTPIAFGKDASLSLYFTVPIVGWTATQ